jgi:hypothetical protein
MKDGGKITMKFMRTVKISGYCAVIALFAGCHDYQLATSHFGTGRYHCFYHNVQTGHFFKGVADTQKEASAIAQTVCLSSLAKNNQALTQCQFADCLFK